jgi:hypothetical protein
MLGMIRQYALDRLARAGGLDAALSRLAGFYLRSAPDAERGLRSVEQRRWKRLVDAEADNLRAVLAWLAGGRTAELMTLLRSLWMWFWLSGQFDEWRRWSRCGLEGGEGAVADRAWVVGIDAGFAFLRGDYATAAGELEQGRLLFREAGDRLGSALMDLVAGLITAAVEGEQPAQARVANSLNTFERLDDAWGVAMGLNATAWLRTVFARFDDAGDLFERALAASERVGDDLQIVMALGNLAEARLAARDPARAREAVERALTLLGASGSTYNANWLLETLARCSVADGDHAGATELVGAAEALREAIREPMWGPARERHEALLADLRRVLGDAAFRAARDRGRAKRPDQFAISAASGER